MSLGGYVITSKRLAYVQDFKRKQVRTIAISKENFVFKIPKVTFLLWFDRLRRSLALQINPEKIRSLSKQFTPTQTVHRDRRWSRQRRGSIFVKIFPY